MPENTTYITDAPIKCVLSHLNKTPVLAIPTLPHNNQDLKRVLGATFLTSHSVWVFPAFYPYIDDVVHDLKIVLPNIDFSSEVKEHLKTCEKVATALKQDPIPNTYRPDFKFVTDPFPHQVEALNFALLLDRCGIFYDCGLGKTKIVIDLVRHEREKTLILVPAVGVTNWFNEIETHSQGELRAIRISGTPKEKRKAIEDSPNYDIVIAGYDTAKCYFESLISTFNYTTIVADESHNLRTGKSARTKGAIALSAPAHRRVILSGTPSLGNPLHFWGQLYFLGRFIPAISEYKFKKHFTIQGKRNPRIIVGFKNLGILNEKVNRISVRRKLEECVDLPSRRTIDIPVEITSEQRKVYNDLVDDAFAALQDGSLYEIAHITTVIQKLLQILSGFFIKPPPEICDGCEYVHQCVDQKIKPYTIQCVKDQGPPPRATYIMRENPKIEVLRELLASILAEERNKVIIWGYFIAELSLIAEMLEKEGIRYVRVDGSNSNRAPDIAKEFNENPEIRVYLANISTGTVLTLTSAAYMIYFGLTYRLDDYQQSMNRNYRIGQKLPVVVYRLMVPKSVLEFVAIALACKQDIAETLTTKINCVLCERGAECLEKGIEPFSKECKYDDRVKRIVTRPQKL